MEVVESARSCNSKEIVAFGMGGDELSIATEAFRPAYEKASEIGLHRLMHAGEVGGPEKFVKPLISSAPTHRPRHRRNPRSSLDGFARRTPDSTEVCPGSNLKTGALAASCAAKASNSRTILCRSFCGTGSSCPLHRRPRDVRYDVADRIRKRGSHGTSGR